MIRPFGDGRDRYFTERLGMFIHWGLYAIPAWHEQILWRSDMKRRDYEQLVHRFDPDRFDPDEWLVAAESAGMSFVVITTKHHDGFCLWDTKLTDYSVMHTPYGRDILAELAEACARRGIALGFYYSCPDWHHPHYPNPGSPPRDVRSAPRRPAGPRRLLGVRPRPGAGALHQLRSAA